MIAKVIAVDPGCLLPGLARVQSRNVSHSRNSSNEEFSTENESNTTFGRAVGAMDGKGRQTD